MKTIEQQVEEMRQPDTRPRDAFGFPITGTGWAVSSKLAVIKHKSKRAKSVKPLFPVVGPAFEQNSVEFAYKSFCFFASDLKESGRGRKMFYQENQLALRSMARDAADRCKIPFVELVTFIRENVPTLVPVFAAVDLEAEEGRPAGVSDEWWDKAIAEEQARTEAREAVRQSEEIEAKARKALARKNQRAEARRLREKRLEEERIAAEAAAVARQEAARVRVESEAGITQEEAQEAVEEPETVPESEEVKTEARRRKFASIGIVGVSPRRRRAEQYLKELAAK